MNKSYTYKFRSYPMSILPINELWCITGTFRNGYYDRGTGVLEWCYSFEDASYLLEFMQLDNRFSNLSIEKYIK